MSKFQYNLVVIGAGSAGLVSSLVAARAGAKVALVEQNRMGGDCLYTGCVPSKTLIASAKVAHQIRHADQFGIAASEPIIDFEAILNRVKRVIAGIEPHDSKERYEKLGVECIGGTASLASPHEVQVDGRNLSTKSVIARDRIDAITATHQRPRRTTSLNVGHSLESRVLTWANYGTWRRSNRL